MTFSAVATLKSFTRAAYCLGLSQSAVSQQIKELEQYFGHALVERTTRRMALTAEGECLLAHATEMIARLRAARSELDGVQGRQDGHLQVGSTPTIGTYRLPALLARFRCEMPLVRVSVQIEQMPCLLQALVGSDLDVLLTPHPLPEDVRGDYAQELLGREDLAAIVAGDHDWAGRQVVEPPDVPFENLITAPAGSPAHALVVNKFRAIGVEPTRCLLEMNNSEGIKSAVEAGLGFGVVPRDAVLGELASGKLVEVEIRGLSISRDIWIVSRFPPSRSAVASRFRDIALQASRPPLTLSIATLPDQTCSL